MPGMDFDFDSLSIHRPELAASYLGLLVAQPGRPLALFAPRRIGKTFFLDQDLTPAARKKGWYPVYADLWLQRGAPLAAINHALEEALDDATVPKSGAGRVAKTSVTKLGALGVSVDLGSAPERRKLPEAPELRFDSLIQRLHTASGKPILLMLDEAQALADGPNSEALAGSLRAVLHKRRAQVYAVLTGSSPDALAQLLASAGAPMYHFAQVLNFPPLGDEYLQALAEHYARIHRKARKLDLAALRQLFERLGHKPALLRDVVKAMSAEGITDVDRGFALYLADERHIAGWRALIDTLQPLERELAAAIAQGLAPLGAETRALIARLPGQGVPSVGKLRSAIERLRKLGVLTRSGAPQVEDPFLQAWLVGKPPA